MYGTHLVLVAPRPVFGASPQKRNASGICDVPTQTIILIPSRPVGL